MKAVAIAASLGGSVCALLSDQTVRCWGDNGFGELGTPATTQPVVTPEPVSSVTAATQIAIGTSSGCAVTRGGSVQCWGDNRDGQLGIGTVGTSDASATVGPVVNLAGVEDVAVSDFAACALLTAGSVTCWGDNGVGELGIGTTNTPKPTATLTLVSGATSIAMGRDFGCAVLESGAVSCWGDNGVGQLGTGATGGTNPTPSVVAGVSGVTAVATGAAHVCAILGGGTVTCWGEGFSGQLGNGSTVVAVPSPTPPIAGLAGVTAIAAGVSHTCALISGGVVECWGDNSSGELGNGTVTTQPQTTPVEVRGLSGGTAIAAGNTLTCALLGTGAVDCWGGPFATPQPSPVQVEW